MSVAQTFLFAVGNSKTTWDQLPKLPGVARDVDSIFDALVEGRGLGLASPQSVKLLDKNAQEVKLRWEKFIEEIDADALVVFYFAGHGVLVGRHDLRLLLADSKSAQKSTSTLSVLEVVRALENKSVAEWAVILDCCNSGAATLDKAIQARSRTNLGSIIACATYESVWETPEQGAPFTSHLTEAFCTGSCMPPGSDFVDIYRAVTWAKEQIPKPHPIVDHWGSADLRVARIATPSVDLRPVAVLGGGDQTDTLKPTADDSLPFVHGGPFLDRRELKERLLTMRDSHKLPITVVEGDGCSGKSRTLDLMSEMGLNPIEIRLSDYEPDEYMALLHHIHIRLGVTIPAADLSWLRALAHLRDQLRDYRGQSWLFIDDSHLRENVREFGDILQALFQAAPASRCLRIVIARNPGDNPSRWYRFCRVLRLKQIERKHIIQWFEETLPADRVTAAIESLESFPEIRGMNLELLSDRVWEVFHKAGGRIG